MFKWIEFRIVNRDDMWY